MVTPSSIPSQSPSHQSRGGAGSFRIVVIGAGPAGLTFASLLALEGVDVTVIDDGRRPERVVGESLIPAVIPVIQRLGIEEAVARLGTRKPGATFTHHRDAVIEFFFQDINRQCPSYAYNVPRPAFDRLLMERAIELGVRIVKARAGLEVEQDPEFPEQGRPRLDRATLDRIPGLEGRQPGLLVDATGRTRALARLLKIPSTRGPRTDVAYFAHYRGVQSDSPPGQVGIYCLEKGWAWRIPLKNETSIGLVIDKDEAARLGQAPEQRLEMALRRDAVLGRELQHAVRITDVLTYANYQLISEEGAGPGWVTLGDAFGFVDPMLSSGLFMAMESGQLLASRLKPLLRDPAVVPNEEAVLDACRRSIEDTRQWLEAWSWLIEYFYDGRIFALDAAGQSVDAPPILRPVVKLMQHHTRRHVAGMASGALTRATYSRKLLSFASRHLTKDTPSAQEMAIR